MLENRFVRLALSIVSLIVLAIIMGIFDTSVATFTVLLVHLIAIVHQVCMDILNVRKFNGTAYEKIRKTISYAVSGLFVLLSLIFTFDQKNATFGLVLFSNAAFPSCVLTMCMCIISDREDADRKWLPLIPVASYAGGLLIGLLGAALCVAVGSFMRFIMIPVVLIGASVGMYFLLKKSSLFEKKHLDPRSYHALPSTPPKPNQQPRAQHGPESRQSVWD